jgi:membrane protein YdbS with pleckstrin-like domain
MNCPACSTEVPAGSTFCPKCGHRLDGTPPTAAQPTAADRIRAAKGSGAPVDVTEQQLWHGTFSPKAMIGSWLLAGVLTAAAVALCIFIPPVWIAAVALVPLLWLSLGAYLLYERLSVDYTLTTQRLIHKSGVLRRVSNRIEVIDIDDVTFEQGLVERMFGVGTIKLLSTDESHPKLHLRGIDDVHRVATLIDDARRDERR